MHGLLARTATAASLGFLWTLPPSSPAVAGTQPPTKDNSFDIEFIDLPNSATRVMFYVAVGVSIVVAGTLIGLLVYRGRPDNGSGFG
jgi:hypothetical protein